MIEINKNAQFAHKINFKINKVKKNARTVNQDLNQAKIKKAVFLVPQEHFSIVKNKNVNFAQIISFKILKVN